MYVYNAICRHYKNIRYKKLFYTVHIFMKALFTEHLLSPRLRKNIMIIGVTSVMGLYSVYMWLWLKLTYSVRGRVMVHVDLHK